MNEMAKKQRVKDITINNLEKIKNLLLPPDLKVQGGYENFHTAKRLFKDWRKSGFCAKYYDHPTCWPNFEVNRCSDCPIRNIPVECFSEDVCFDKSHPCTKLKLRKKISDGFEDRSSNRNKIREDIDKFIEFIKTI